MIVLRRRSPKVGDANYSSVGLLLHGDGTDGSTSFPDNGPGAKTATVIGNTQVDTAQSKFGGASILFDGTGDRMTFPNSPDWDFGTGDFTIEFWLRITINPPNSYAGIVIAGTGSNWKIQFEGTARQMRFEAAGSSLSMTSNPAFALDTWTHIALTRASGTVRWFCDGAAQGSASIAGNINSSGAGINLGSDAFGGGNHHNGWVDDLRITKGVARYTAAFTPPTEAFPDSA